MFSLSIKWNFLFLFVNILIFLLMFETWRYVDRHYVELARSIQANTADQISDLEYSNSYLKEHLYQSNIELERLEIRLKQISATCAPTTITTTDRDARTVIGPV